MQNSDTHAYSVLVFLLILLFGNTLAVPSVFSQSSTDDTVEQATEVTTAQDPYKRERLSDKSVFSDFVVGPGRFELEIAPGESEVVEMVITNRMGVTKQFRFETEDMEGTSDGSETVVLLGDRRGPYTIRDYITVPQQVFTLEHAERVRIPVTVSIPADAEPGGAYGSLLVSIVSETNNGEENTGARPNSVVVSRIGTLFFVTSPGEVTKEAKLHDLTTVGDQFIFGKGPIPFTIVYENLGSVHLVPYGEIRIYNTTGNEVGMVELQPWFVLPKSLRVREVTWDRDFLAGRYTAVLKINRGYDDIIDERSFVFWVIPWKLLGVVFVGLFVFFLGLRFIFTRFEFKRKDTNV